MSEIGAREFYRYMSTEEVRAIEDTGLLRGGRPGETHWTKDRYETAADAKASLSLEEYPEVRLRFRILVYPSRIEKEGSTVRAQHGEPGGGTEWMSDERVAVVIEDVHEIA